jgi:hypothetical protein
VNDRRRSPAVPVVRQAVDRHEVNIHVDQTAVRVLGALRLRPSGLGEVVSIQASWSCSGAAPSDECPVRTQPAAHSSFPSTAIRDRDMRLTRRVIAQLAIFGVGGRDRRLYSCPSHHTWASASTLFTPWVGIMIASSAKPNPPRSDCPAA